MTLSKGICLTAIALSGTLLGGCATLQNYTVSQSPPFVEKKIAPPVTSVLAHGHEFETLEPVEKLFTSPKALYQWARNQGHMGTRVMSAAKGIDFTRQHVVVISPGIQPHAGYTLSLLSQNIDYAMAHGSLQLRINQPLGSAVYAQAVAAPYLVVQVPAQSYKHIAIDYEACPLQQVATPG